MLRATALAATLAIFAQSAFGAGQESAFTCDAIGTGTLMLHDDATTEHNVTAYCGPKGPTVKRVSDDGAKWVTWSLLGDGSTRFVAFEQIADYAEMDPQPERPWRDINRGPTADEVTEGTAWFAIADQRISEMAEQQAGLAAVDFVEHPAGAPFATDAQQTVAIAGNGEVLDLGASGGPLVPARITEADITAAVEAEGGDWNRAVATAALAKNDPLRLSLIYAFHGQRPPKSSRTPVM